MLKMDYSVNENKINGWLDEVNNDRSKLFSEIKNSSTLGDKVKEDKIRSLDTITRSIMSYRKILIKDKEKNIA